MHICLYRFIPARTETRFSPAVEKCL